MPSIELREGQVIEVLFDAEDFLTAQDWHAPPCEPSRHIPLFISIPRSSRRSSTSSCSSSSYASSLASPLLLSPTRPPSPTTCAWDAARRTAPRPTSAFLPRTRGLDETALFLLGAPGAEDRLRQLVRAAAIAAVPVGRAAAAARETTARKNIKGPVEVTESMSIQRLREEIARAEHGTRRAEGMFRGVRKRFQLLG